MNDSPELSSSPITLPFDWDFPYPSQRMPVLAANVVATSQPLAAQAGLAMLQRGGNAVDAALACAIALTVVEPTGNGLGSDAFALVWDGTRLHGLNASGRAPKAWSPERFQGMTAMPVLGWEAVTVPGAVAGWVALSRRFGKLPFADLFELAIRYAADGFLVSPTIARLWAAMAPVLASQPGFAQAYLPKGRPPLPGERFAFPDLAKSLAMIAASEGEAFYRGELAERIAAHARAHGAALTLEDLASHAVDWVEPVAQRYRGFTLHEIPPNTQGIAALEALGILSHFDLASCPADSADSVHLQVEAMKLAFADLYRYVGDPASMTVTPAELLDPAYLRERVTRIDRKKASRPAHRHPGGGTVYLTAADASGMMVSLIQSNYMGFGSGVVVPGTGVSLQNRGAGFVLAEGHPNQVAGGKRPLHTIIPGFVTRDGAPVMSFGVMGGAMQAQGHVQILVRLADYRQNPQAAADGPRWRIDPGDILAVEHSMPAATVEALRRRGHVVRVAPRFATEFGRAQAIYRLEGGYLGASEPRADGQAVGY
ncbi:MAG: gamma-glutamyltransferase [Burkholderiales bacterium]|nr:MAG: gamma-glutamyltransferase [Burkholderiales bacterium]